MCDYSLEHYKSRSATVGDDLTLVRFSSGSKGFIRPNEADCPSCIKDGHLLQVTGLDGKARTAEYCRLEQGPYHDGLLFEDDNLPTSLQDLPVGMKATVVMIGRPHADGGTVIAPAARELEIIQT